MSNSDSQHSTYEVGQTDFSQFTQRTITVPPSEEYFLVGADKLERLSEYRASWTLEGCLAAVGVMLGSVISAISGLEEGTPKDIEAFASAILFIGGTVAAVVLGIICILNRGKFSTLMESIKQGKRLISEGGIVVEASNE